MDKVSNSNMYMQPMSSSMTKASEQGTPIWDRAESPRGHHSAVNKAVNAHRLRTEERTNRQFNRGRTAEPTERNHVAAEARVAQQEEQMYSEVPGEEMDMMYDTNMIEPARSMAKTAAVNSFTAVEGDRPVTVGEPVPKGSYLDVEG